jgi:hypothetical protein
VHANALHSLVCHAMEVHTNASPGLVCHVTERWPFARKFAKHKAFIYNSEIL